MGKDEQLMKKSIPGNLVLGLLLVLFLVGCSSDDDSNPTDPGGGDDPGQPAGGFSGALPEGVGHDFHVDANTRGPGGASISDGDSDYGRLAEGSPSVDGFITGTNDNCEGYDFAYEGRAEASLSPGSMFSRSRIQAEGNGTNRVDEYDSWGMHYYDIYFTAHSNNPATTRVACSVSFSSTGILSFDFGSSDDTDYVNVRAGGSFSAKVYTTGWWEGEIGEQFDLMDLVAEEKGGVAIGYELGRFTATATGYMEGSASVGDQQRNIADSSSLTFEVVPDEIYCLRYSMSNMSTIDFHGMYGFPANAVAGFEFTTTFDRPDAGVDPDNPGADITMTIHSATIGQP